MHIMLYGRSFLSQNDRARICQEKSNARVCMYIVVKRSLMLEYAVVKRSLMLGVCTVDKHPCLQMVQTTTIFQQMYSKSESTITNLHMQKNKKLVKYITFSGSGKSRGKTNKLSKGVPANTKQYIHTLQH